MPNEISAQTQAILGDMARYEPRAMMTQAPIVWEHADGHVITDLDGKSYIDFSSGIIVANVGHAHPRLVAALREMLDQKLLHGYLFGTRVRAQLAKALVDFTPANLTKACLLSTGTEVIEAAMKISRMHGLSIHPRKNVIVAFQGSFHGRTMAAQMLADREPDKQWITCRDPDIVHLPFPYDGDAGAWTLKRDLRELEDAGIDPARIAAFVVEGYQGIHGPTFWPISYVHALRSWAGDNEALIIIDEIQSGFGRTGKLFCYEHYGIDADLVCVGKGMGGGLPISAVLGPARLLDLPEAGQMTSTHSGNPLCCAAALATIQIMQDADLVNEAARKGRIIEQKLATIRQRFPDRIGKVSGKGMVFSIYFVKPGTQEYDVDTGCRATEQAIANGLMLYLTHSDMVKLTPPLSIPDDALIEGLDILADTVKQVICGA